MIKAISRRDAEAERIREQQMTMCDGCSVGEKIVIQNKRRSSQMKLVTLFCCLCDLCSVRVWGFLKLLAALHCLWAFILRMLRGLHGASQAPPPTSQTPDTKLPATASAVADRTR
jgi:hypothetical protein